MYFKDFIVGLRRRWYVALIGLLITAGLCIGVAQLVSVTYTSTTSLLMLPPRSTVTSKGNQYLNLGGLGQALEVLSIRINASDRARQITDAHPDATIDVGPDVTTAGPILLISATANSPQESMEIRDDLSQLAPQVLVAMQDELSIQPNSRITVSLLASDPEATKAIKNQLRALITVAAIGGGGTILGTGYLDYFLALRSGAPVRRRRRKRSAPTGESWWDFADQPGSPGGSTVSAVSSAGPVPDSPVQVGPAEANSSKPVPGVSEPAAANGSSAATDGGTAVDETSAANGSSPAADGGTAADETATADRNDSDDRPSDGTAVAQPVNSELVIARPGNDER